jgi:hypothetical protein
MSKHGVPIPSSVTKSIESTRVDYVRVGDSGLKVSWPILGTMAMGFSPIIPWVKGEEESLEILKAAYDCGINTWDTANTYCNGRGEEIIGKAITKFNIPRHKLVIMTKCAHPVGEEPDVIGTAYPELLVQTKDYINQAGRYISRYLVQSRVLTSGTQACPVAPSSAPWRLRWHVWVQRTLTCCKSIATTPILPLKRP